jgi:DNA-directed RNA polymerase subunit K/omega
MDSETISSTIDTEDVIMSDEGMTIEDNCILDSIIQQKTEQNKYEIVDKKNRITKNKLTMYEFVRIIGERTKQLTMGAKPLVKINKESDAFEYKEIAIEELRYDMVPFKVKRFINDKYELWDLSELKKDHLKHLFN